VQLAGASGVPGYTPIKGTDYFTESEITEITTDVSDRILNTTLDNATAKTFRNNIGAAATEDVVFSVNGYTPDDSGNIDLSGWIPDGVIKYTEDQGLDPDEQKCARDNINALSADSDTIIETITPLIE
jgi:hypothetical protein